jgi:hypothetical protein
MRFARRVGCGLLVALALAAGVSAAARDSTSASVKWQTLSVGKTAGVFPLGRASGRVWFVTEGLQGSYTLWSARAVGGRLTSLVSTSEGKDEWLPSSFIIGSSLVDCCRVATSSSAAPLLANGKAGAWAPIPGNPEKLTETTLTPAGQGNDSRWLARAAITVAGRTVYAIQGHTCPPDGQPHQCTINGGGISWFALCCTAAGQPRDLSSLLTNQYRGTGTDPAFGLDVHGRLWLAWLDGASSKPGIAFKLVQLDPSNLNPLSVQKIDHVLLDDMGQPSSFDLACADRCRLFYQGLRGAYSWGGTGKPARLWATNFRTGTGGFMLGAALRAGGLDVAHYRIPSAQSQAQRLTLQHGNALGRNLRARRTAAVPPTLPNGPTHYFFPLGTPTVLFSPTGLVALQLYNSDRRSGPPSRLLGAALHG